FEGNRYGIREVELPKEEQKSLKDVVGSFYEENRTHGVSLGTSGKTMFGGGGDNRDEEAVDQEKYFRWVDRYIHENHSKRTDLPLILAALPEHHAEFQKLSHNQYLLKDGIKKDPQTVTPEEFISFAWNLLSPKYTENIRKLHEKYEFNKSRELASEDLSEIARAAATARVDTLIVNLDATVPGSINKDLGHLSHEDTGTDLLNDLALLALEQKAKVIVVSNGEIPLETGVKSIFRYPEPNRA
uniref:baeRF3 domain-containing protein n=1 Tax=Proteiniclasticum sp. TaxID=2053595 RepID=UPI00289D43F3